MTVTRDPLVSVVVPARNAAATLERCLRSLLDLDYPRDRFEIIVADNGSTDGSRSILDRFGGQVRVVEQPRPGPAAARNAGIRAAEGTVIALTDADC